MLFHLYFFILSVRMIIYLWWIRNYFDSTQEKNEKISQALNRLIVIIYSNTILFSLFYPARMFFIDRQRIIDDERAKYILKNAHRRVQVWWKRLIIGNQRRGFQTDMYTIKCIDFKHNII